MKFSRNQTKPKGYSKWWIFFIDIIEWNIMKLMWAELNCVQEARDIMESDCVLHQFDIKLIS
jgi:hypothetical protein